MELGGGDQWFSTLGSKEPPRRGTQEEGQVQFCLASAIEHFCVLVRDKQIFQVCMPNILLLRTSGTDETGEILKCKTEKEKVAKVY